MRWLGHLLMRLASVLAVWGGKLTRCRRCGSSFCDRGEDCDGLPF